MLNGRIKIISEVGKGSEFYVSFPLQNKKDARLAIPELDSKNMDKLDEMKDLTLLIVEDDRVGKMYMETLFKNRCKSILFASNGIEAVKICEDNPNIDLILMDIKMPVMDGYEATKKIKSINKNIIVIAQTAFALVGDEQKALAAGCDDYITKPIKKENLFKVINKYYKS